MNKILLILAVFLGACSETTKISLPLKVTSVSRYDHKGCELILGNTYSGETVYTTVAQENCAYVVGQEIK